MRHHPLSSPFCLLFPGQGAQQLPMLENIQHHAIFKEYYQVVCNVLGFDLLGELRMRDVDYINRNLISSILVVLTSCVSYRIFLSNTAASPAFVFGYSVGQWTSLYAASSVSFPQLIEIVTKRAQIMDKCVTANPSGMIAVLGVDEERLTEFCLNLQRQGYYIAISNYNSRGQYSLSGTEAAIKKALVDLDSLDPKKYLRIPVSGGWHSSLLVDAAVEFANYLVGVDLKAPVIPVLDNVTGDFLPRNADKIKLLLSKHLSSPVLWEKGIKKLIHENCTYHIEMGYGTTLTKFGFFIDRSIHHQPYYCNHIQEEISCAE